MGYCSFHQAVPENSDLFRLLENDRLAEALLTWFWSEGSHPLKFREMGDEDVEEHLNSYVKQAKVKRTIAQSMFDRLKAAVKRTCIEHPGLEGRTAFLEKSHVQIQEWLKNRFSLTGLEDGPRIAQQFLFGNSGGHDYGSFGRYDSALVRQAAAFFLEHDDFALSDEADDWFGDDLQRLADLFIAADRCGEIVLMYGE